MDAVRRGLVQAADPVVVKVGTNVLADASGLLDRRRIESLAGQLLRLRAGGRRVVLVTSGAIGAGIGRLGLSGRPTDLSQLQACAAVGQTALMQMYQDALAPHGILAAQVLLTAGDFDHRVRYLNVRNTLRTLFEYSCLPIINENDTVSTAEIKFGDNDQLAAMTANLLLAPLLILLTNVDGLFTADPQLDTTAILQTTVERIDAAVSDLAGATKSGLGTGGMKSKLKAARIATSAGTAVIMANGAVDGILDRLFASEPVGTLFLPKVDAVSARKRWLGFTARPRGELMLDAGAVIAVRLQGKSLLPVGVTKVIGDFSKGDVLVMNDADGREVARGITNYGAVDAEKIAGVKTDRIAAVLGKLPYVELIHRDHLVVTTPGALDLVP